MIKQGEEHTVKLNEDDWTTILALLDTGKAEAEREDVLLVQEIYTKIKQQIKEQIENEN